MTGRDKTVTAIAALFIIALFLVIGARDEPRSPIVGPTLQEQANDFARAYAATYWGLPSPENARIRCDRRRGKYFCEVTGEAPVNCSIAPCGTVVRTFGLVFREARAGDETSGGVGAYGDEFVVIRSDF